ncbi:MAG: Asp-tRNA(Asn)/Glu-tRNA(Gln) amidotransferase subunit GatB [Chloroflexota bacterium]
MTVGATEHTGPRGAADGERLHGYEPVIGLEVHAQLLTASKMFCGCSADYADAPPNSHVCPVCLGMPGVLPVINQEAVRQTVMTGLALHCEIPEFSKFDRKNYPYPDLVKGYQISQYDLPLCRHGFLDVKTAGGIKRIGITRVHLEEDTAKLTHRADGHDPYSLMDVNRSGLPLMEIVSEPDINSPEEARLYFMTLRGVLQYLGVNNGDMEKGSLRCDVNISLRPAGTTGLHNPKTEIKNVNSFRAVMRALEYEIERQRRELTAGRSLLQETRGWDETGGVTKPQREMALGHVVRYFPAPDLPPLVTSRARVEEIRAALPELADARAVRFMNEYGVPEAVADQLTASKDLADYFEEAVRLTPGRDARAVSTWVVGDLQYHLHEAALDLVDGKVSPRHLAGMLGLMANGTLSSKLAKQVFERMFATGKDAETIVREENLVQVSDASALETVVRAVVEQNPQPVEDYRAGKTAAFQFLVGKVMAATRGKADPNLTRRILKRTLEIGDVGG